MGARPITSSRLSADNTSNNFYDQTFTYNRAGSMISNDHVGTYAYTAGGPEFAPDSIDDGAGGITNLTQVPPVRG